jgi:hypothetical protein
MMGAITRHGPHQGAHASTRTGSGERSTSTENVASVTVTGLLTIASDVLHRPQTGWSPCAILSRSIRFVVPHTGQRMNCGAAMASYDTAFFASIIPRRGAPRWRQS